MKQIKKATAIVLLLAMTAGLLFLPMSRAVDSRDSASEISIVFTADMHSNFDPVRFMAEDGNVAERGGFARLQTAIDHVRDAHPNTFVFDAGDWSMGTIFQTIFTHEAPELRLMGQLGFDAAVIGNHEFDYHAAGFTDMLHAAMVSGDELPGLALANIDWDRTLADPALAGDAGALRAAMDQYGVALDYMLIERGGVTAAVFGVMGPRPITYIPEAGLLFHDYIETARAVVARIQAETDADIIIALSHSGFNPENPQGSDCGRLAEAVDGIDLLISGHSHNIVDEPVIINDTIIVSAGSRTFHLGHIVLGQSDAGFTVEAYDMIPISQDLPKDMAVQTRIDAFRVMVDQYYLSMFDFTYDQVLAYSPFAFTPIEEFGRHLGEEPLGNLIANAYIYAVQRAEGEHFSPVYAAIAPRGVIRASFPQGPITVADAFAVSSLGIGPDGVPGFPLVSLYLYGRELRTIAEIDISVSTLMSGARLYIAGLTYTFNPNRLLLNRVTSVQLMDLHGDVSDLEPDRLYRVVGGLYSAQMLGTVESLSFGLLQLTPKDAYGNPIENMEDHIIHYGDMELKEWLALAWYLESFDLESGVPTVPARYNDVMGRKIEVNSWSPIELLRAPNRVFFLLLGVIVLLLAIIVLVTIVIVRLVRKRKRKKAAVAE
ncbi:MAG: bifunctional metallophosphatase/5'-nucleotidase [Oscillospiraceae bacterium]|nr:bifunctional metallophosphatase/5'-nucleotidase [Oscillospiraceae bacterium]